MLMKLHGSSFSDIFKRHNLTSHSILPVPPVLTVFSPSLSPSPLLQTTLINLSLRYRNCVVVNVPIRPEH